MVDELLSHSEQNRAGIGCSREPFVLTLDLKLSNHTVSEKRADISRMSLAQTTSLFVPQSQFSSIIESTVLTIGRVDLLFVFDLASYALRLPIEVSHLCLTTILSSEEVRASIV